MAVKTILCVFVLILSLPLFLHFSTWTAKSVSTPTEDHTEEGVKIIEEAVTPWWLGLVNWLSGLGTIGALLIVGLFWILKENDTF